MNLLIGVMTCHAAPESTIAMPERTQLDHTLRLPAIRETWATRNTKFFFGRGERNVQADEVILDCGDSYYETAFKVQAMCQWALVHGHDGLFKTDDDTYVRPERIETAGWEKHDFVCRVLPGTLDINHPVPYPYGGCGYYLSKRMMEIAANDKWPCTKPEGDTWDRCNTYEDAWIGRVARDAGIELIDDHRLIALRHGGDFEGHPWQAEFPVKSNNCIAVCEFPGDLMRFAHEYWLKSQ